MRHLFYTIQLCAALFSLSPLIAAEPAPSLEESMLPYIAKISDDNFDVREAAAKALSDLSRDREDEAVRILAVAEAKLTDPHARARIKTLLRDLQVTGLKDWSVEAGQIYQLPAIANGRVYVGNKDNFIYCHDAANGRLIWKYSVGGFLFKSLAVADGRVIAIRTRKDGRPDGTIIALDAADGRVLWTWQDGIKSQYFTAPICADGALYFAREKKLIRLNALSGELDWSFEASNTILSPASVSSGRVLIGTLDEDLTCLEAATGKKIWDATLAGPVYSGGIISDDRVFAGGGNSLYRIDFKTGAIVWEYKSAEAVATAPAAKGNHVYAAFGIAFRCIDAVKGRELWEKDTGGHIFAAPAIVGNRVYTGALNDKLTLYCLNALTGEELWTHVTQEGGYAEPILAGRRLFVGYHSKFYCLNTGLPGPPDWPLSSGNPSRTGCNDLEKK